MGLEALTEFPSFSVLFSAIHSTSLHTYMWWWWWWGSRVCLPPPSTSNFFFFLFRSASRWAPCRCTWAGSLEDNENGRKRMCEKKKNGNKFFKLCGNKKVSPRMNLYFKNFLLKNSQIFLISGNRWKIETKSETLVLKLVKIRKKGTCYSNHNTFQYRLASRRYAPLKWQ